MRRIASLLAVLTLTVASCSSGGDEPGADPTSTSPSGTVSDLPVEGYLSVTDDAAAIVEQNAEAISIVGVDGVTVEPGGASVTEPPKAAADAVKAAHAAGLEAELLVANFDGEQGDFSTDRATELLFSPENRQAVAEQLADQVEAGDYDGLQLDLESLDATHTDGLVDLAQRLRDVLPVRAGLSMAVMASPNAEEYLDTGYDFERLPDLVDRFVLMGYDQHGPDWSPAGPVGGTPWVKGTLKALLATGVAADRVDLGIATFGYRWDSDDDNEDYLTVAEARKLAGDAATWDDTEQEWTAQLDDGTTIWWSDARTLELRQAFAAEQGLNGVAIWELGTGDPLA